MGFFGWERKVFWTSILVRWGFPGGTMIKKLPANAGNVRDVGLICRSGRSPGGGQGNPLQYSYLENPLGRGAWKATVHSIAKSQTWLHDLAHTLVKGLTHRKGFCMCLKLRKWISGVWKWFLLLLLREQDVVKKGVQNHIMKTDLYKTHSQKIRGRCVGSGHKA